MSQAVRIFQDFVNQRGDRLRKPAFQHLKQLTEPTELITIEKRKAKISIIVNPLPSGAILVVVQGFMKKRFLPMVWDVALDGFYKYPDETMPPMNREDMWAYD